MGIKDIILRVKGLFNPQKRLDIAKENEIASQTNNNDFSTNLRIKTQEDIKKMREDFEGMTPDQLREELLKAAGIKQEFLDNPVAKEMLIAELEAIKIDGYDINITDKVMLIPTAENNANMEQEKPARQLIDAMKNKIHIKNDTIEIVNETKDVQLVYAMNESDFILSRKSKLDEKVCEEIRTYNAKGIQTKLEFYEDRPNSEENVIEQNKRHEVVVERIDIDKAKCNKNGQIYFIDLTTANKDISTLDVAKYGIGDNKIYGDTVYEEIPPESPLAKERKNIIQEMMDKSKYSKACYEYVGTELYGQVI